MKIAILNGPNLNMLGKREPEIYGSLSLSDIEKKCADEAKKLNLEIDFFQSNHEGEMVSKIQSLLDQNTDGIVINAAAYTHTSVAILDALKAVNIQVIEVHLSNIHARETFRHHSYISPIAKAVICGLGVDGYLAALNHFSNQKS